MIAIPKPRTQRVGDLYDEPFAFAPVLNRTKVAAVLVDLLLHVRFEVREPRVHRHSHLNLPVLDGFEPALSSDVVLLFDGPVEEVLGRLAKARDSVQSPDRLPRGVQSIQTYEVSRRFSPLLLDVLPREVAVDVVRFSEQGPEEPLVVLVLRGEVDFVIHELYSPHHPVFPFQIVPQEDEHGRLTVRTPPCLP